MKQPPLLPLASVIRPLDAPATTHAVVNFEVFRGDAKTAKSVRDDRYARKSLIEVLTWLNIASATYYGLHTNFNRQHHTNDAEILMTDGLLKIRVSTYTGTLKNIISIDGKPLDWVDVWHRWTKLLQRKAEPTLKMHVAPAVNTSQPAAPAPALVMQPKPRKKKSKVNGKLDGAMKHMGLVRKFILAAWQARDVNAFIFRQQLYDLIDDIWQARASRKSMAALLRAMEYSSNRQLLICVGDDAFGFGAWGMSMIQKAERTMRPVALPPPVAAPVALLPPVAAPVAVNDPVESLRARLAEAQRVSAESNEAVSRLRAEIQVAERRAVEIVEITRRARELGLTVSVS